MFTYNITFVVAPEKEAELLKYLREELLPALFKEGSEARDPQLKKLVEAGGEKPGAEHGLSVALAVTLQDEKGAHQWNEYYLMPALQDFHIKFGTDALFFVTLLENLPI